MNCSNCGYDNEESANFCSNCGVELKETCRNCGTLNDPAANFCFNCGFALRQRQKEEAHIGSRRRKLVAQRPSAYTPHHLAQKILRGRKSISGERRTVTILFVDEVGSTAIGERLDPEVLYGVTQDALRHMMDAVYLYEGTVTQFRGDGIMALFGAPIAHEDAARRGVRAALEMQLSLGAFAAEVREQLGIDLSFRVGLNTGRVVVGNIGDDLDMEFTALGDSVNLAARMEGAAEPGTVYVTESTYVASKEYFHFEPVGPLRVKGKSEPVTAFKVLEEKTLKTRFDAAVERGLTPFIGRKTELHLLKRRFEQVQGGRGQVIMISGEAGIGKSRLLLEFRRSIQNDLIWLEGQCISFGKHVPYQPVIDIVKEMFHIEESDSEVNIIRRVEERTASMEEGARRATPYLKALLSVDTGDPSVDAMDPRARRAGIFDGLRALLMYLSRKQPIVLVIEDLHWVDEQSEAVLQSLLDVIAASRIFMILTHRPGYNHHLGERTYIDRLSLGELPAEKSAVLAQSILPQTTLPKEFVVLVTQKGDGNPFYIEEVTKSLIEVGVLREQNGNYALARSIEEIHVPDTIQEIILSRIDHLQVEAKATLQLASVIGREFTARLLERISTLEAELEEALAELKTLELIYQEAYLPELSYMFKHALTQDVAYRTLLREQRKTLHRLIGAEIEELYADRISEHIEMLAHHYYEAEDWTRALEYLVKAGDKAVAAAANQDALDYYARALDVCDALGPSTLEVAVGAAGKRARVNRGYKGLEDNIRDYDRMLAYAIELSDRHLEGRALVERGLIHLANHDLANAKQDLKAALAGDEYEDIRLFANIVMAQSLKIYGQHAEAAPYYEAAYELASEVDDPSSRASALNSLAMFAHWEGRFADALEQQAQLGDSVNIEKVQNRNALWFNALSLGGSGEYEKALSLLQRLLALAKRFEEGTAISRILNSIGWIYGELQHHQEAIDWNKRGVKVAHAAKFPDPEVESNARLNLADNLLALGRIAEAEGHYQIIENVIRNARQDVDYAVWRYSQHHFHSYGELWLVHGDLEKALAYAAKCLDLAEESNSRKNIVKGRRLRAQALMAQGRLDEAEEELVVAVGMAKEVGNPTQLWQTHAAIGDLKTLQEQFDEAEKSYQDAVEVIQQVAEKLRDRDLRQTFLASTAVRAIFQKSKHDK